MMIKLHELGPTLVTLDYAGVAVFAATGALAGARLRQDLMTIAFFAVVTGVGGGTLRDLLIGAPVFWIENWAYIFVSVAAAIAVWFLGGRGWRLQALLWLDALGLSAYGVMGAAKAAAFGAPAVICILMGAMTATFGGIIRDTLAGQPSVLLSREVTITAALAAAAVYVSLDALGVDIIWSAIAGALAGFVLRAGALTWGWSLPEFGARLEKDGPPTPDDLHNSEANAP